MKKHWKKTVSLNCKRHQIYFSYCDNWWKTGHETVYFTVTCISTVILIAPLILIKTWTFMRKVIFRFIPIFDYKILRLKQKYIWKKNIIDWLIDYIWFYTVTQYFGHITATFLILTILKVFVSEKTMQNGPEARFQNCSNLTWVWKSIVWRYEFSHLLNL